jgi:hypothetical protein
MYSDPKALSGEPPDPSDRRVLCRQKPCHCCGAIPSHAHHVTYSRGLGQKSYDSMVIPLCWKCHSEFHDARGHFEGWDRERRRAWQESALEQLWPQDVF